MPKLLTYDEVAKHNKADDLWVIIEDKAYDLTEFAPDHPGGAMKVEEQAGRDGTQAFIDAHSLDIMKATLGPAGMKKACKGNVDPATIPSSARSQAPAHEAPPAVADNGIPPLAAMLNLHDFEAVAERRLVSEGKKQAWDYYSSGADDEFTYRENTSVFQRIWLKPRVLVDVKEVDPSSTLLGKATPFPVYLSAVAMCGMGHPDGEAAWMRAAHERGSVFMMPNLSSKSFADMVAAKAKGQRVFFQMYVNPSRDVVLDQIAACEEAGVDALCLTVDSAVPGKRERDRRNKIRVQLGAQVQQAAATGTKARKPGSYANRDAALNWEDIAWFTEHTDIPIVLKGIGCGEDAVKAAKSGVSAIILSNHGGRNLDTSRSGVEMLPEVMAELKRSRCQNRIEVWVDGGIRRGTDVVKCLALGAKAVGLGKPAVYAMSAYGQEGISRMLEILQDEFVMAMQLCGAQSVDDLNAGLVNTSNLEVHMGGLPVVPSPYASNKDVECAVLRAKVAELEAKLALQEARVPTRAMPRGGVSAGHTFLTLLLAVVVGSIKMVVVPSSVPTMLHRSAMFLLMFLVTHAGGNLTAHVSPDMYNLYAKHLASFPQDIVPGFPFALLPVVEAYLLAAFVLHAVIALYQSWGKKKFLMKNLLGNGQLLLTSAVIVGFVVVHVWTFRLGEPSVGRTSDGETVKDYYAMMVETFQDPKQVALYVVAIVAIGWHLSVGFTKTVNKMEVPKDMKKPLDGLGQLLILPLCIAFVSVPLRMFFTK